MFRKRFSDIISSSGAIPFKDYKFLLENTNENKVSEFDLLSLEKFSEEKLFQYIERSYQFPKLDIEGKGVSDSALSLMTKAQARKFRAVPVKIDKDVVFLVSYDPTIGGLKNDISRVVKRRVEISYVRISQWKEYYNLLEESLTDIISTIKTVTEADEKESDTKADIGQDVVNYVNKVLAVSYARKASDIHVECYEYAFRIRLRIDGTLILYEKPDVRLKNAIISRLKIMANMDIAERRLPQDGRIKLSVLGEDIDYRVSSMPTLFGEKIVLRLLDRSNLQLDMTKLGFEKDQLSVFKDAIYRPYGICLVTGPTGSGKTTTLYSALAELNKTTANISTAEDPVEFNLEGINQVNVRSDIGLTFAKALKSFLRQDPDIIMVGEIRDSETGETAIEASLTGHLVLSTLHTNDAPSTVTRLINMGIPSFMLVASLSVVVAQRLARKNCIFCKVKDEDVSVEDLISAGFARSTAEKITVFKGEGCKKCGHTGYKGRVAIYEVLAVTESIKEAILQRKSTTEVKRIAVKEGMKTLRMSALMKVARGETTMIEALTISNSDRER